jgi:hypothetical protein
MDFSQLKNEIWSGAGSSDCHQQLMTHYRGLVAGLHILSSICQANQLTKGLIHMYCDCGKSSEKDHWHLIQRNSRPS